MTDGLTFEPSREKPSYRVVKPRELYQGKTIADWISDWINWFFTPDPDIHNSGPVVFLRGMPSLEYESDMPKVAKSSGLLYYKNDPNVMIGNDRLEIFADQAIFFPVILAYWTATEPSETEAYLRQRVRVDLDSGDDPPIPSQVTFNGHPIELEEWKELDISVRDDFTNAKKEFENGKTSYENAMDKMIEAKDAYDKVKDTEPSDANRKAKETAEKAYADYKIAKDAFHKAKVKYETILGDKNITKVMKSYRVETPVFPLVISEDELGESFKDYVEGTMSQGSWPSVAGGYFFLVEGLKPGDYIIHSHGKGRATEKGQYYSEFLYQVTVREARTRPKARGFGKIPQYITFKILKKLREKKANEEITECEYEDLYHILTTSRTT